MKILCDVCGKEEASVFCCADEAALCGSCDRRVHWANKLAGKHRRFSLSPSSTQSHPLCDICQEKRAFLFCQEDRAILCSDCDASIHGANHLTMKHNRFLLAGVRVSAAPISAPEAEAAASSMTNAIEKSNQGKALVVDTTAAVVPANVTKTAALATAASVITNTSSATATFGTTNGSATSDGSASSISDYLTKMCPGWQVEELLVDNAAAAADARDGFSKVDELLPFFGAAADGGGLEAICAPHVPQFPPVFPPADDGGAAHYQNRLGFNFQQWVKSGEERWSEEAFMVPQISPAPAPNKRPIHSVLYH